jgi:hypothetical protein
MSEPFVSPPAAQQPPGCWQCRHFAMSYHRHTPYLCRLMGFESRILPSIEVLRADGVPCQGFVAKPPTAARPS